MSVNFHLLGRVDWIHGSDRLNFGYTLLAATVYSSTGEETLASQFRRRRIKKAGVFVIVVTVVVFVVVTGKAEEEGKGAKGPSVLQQPFCHLAVAVESSLVISSSV